MDHMAAFSTDAAMQQGLGCTVLTLTVNRVLSASDFSQAHVASPTAQSQSRDLRTALSSQNDGKVQLALTMVDDQRPNGQGSWSNAMKLLEMAIKLKRVDFLHRWYVKAHRARCLDMGGIIKRDGSDLINDKAVVRPQPGITRALVLFQGKDECHTIQQ